MLLWGTPVTTFEDGSCCARSRLCTKSIEQVCDRSALAALTCFSNNRYRNTRCVYKLPGLFLLREKPLLHVHNIMVFVKAKTTDVKCFRVETCHTTFCILQEMHLGFTQLLDSI
jgi:hypothetical protein